MNIGDYVGLLGITFMLATATFCTFYCVPVITGRWIRSEFAAAGLEWPVVMGKVPKTIAMMLLSLAAMAMGGLFVTTVITDIASWFGIP